MKWLQGSYKLYSTNFFLKNLGMFLKISIFCPRIFFNKIAKNILLRQLDVPVCNLITIWVVHKVVTFISNLFFFPPLGVCGWQIWIGLSCTCAVVIESLGRCGRSRHALTASFCLCGYSLPHSSIKWECEIDKILCVSIVTARGCKCLIVC